VLSRPLDSTGQGGAEATSAGFPDGLRQLLKGPGGELVSSDRLAEEVSGGRAEGAAEEGGILWEDAVKDRQCSALDVGSAIEQGEAEARQLPHLADVG